MGASHSREDLEIDSEEEEEEDDQESSDHERYEDAEDTPVSGRSKSSLDDIAARLKALKVKYPGDQRVRNPVKLYLHIGGNTPGAKWVVSDKLTSYCFARTGSLEDDEGDEDEEGGGNFKGTFWVLKVGSKVRARVSSDLQLKMFGDQRRVDFASGGVWAMKFFSNEDYRKFVSKFQDCLFENVHGVRATDENKEKVYGREFIGWVKPEIADDTVWDDAENDLAKSPELSARKRGDGDLVEEFEEAAKGGIQSLTLGALDIEPFSPSRHRGFKPTVNSVTPTLLFALFFLLLCFFLHRFVFEPMAV